MDEFQERYIEHQERKKKQFDNNYDGTKIFYDENKIIELFDILENRRSQRIFNEDPICVGKLEMIKEAARLAPSSCNRQAIYLKKMEPYEADELLVGAKKWSLNADKVYLLLDIL